MKKNNIFFNNCMKNENVVISDVYYNNIKYKIVYVIEMVDIRKFNYEIKLPMTASIIQFEEEIKTDEVEFVFDAGISISEIIIVGGEC